MAELVRERIILGVILVGYLVLATLYAVRVPIWNAPDEPAHYNFIRRIAVDHQLPILQPGDYDHDRLEQLMHAHFPSDQSIASLRYESHQPPLYYLLGSPVFLLTESAGIRRQVIALRLVTVAIGALVILTTYRLATLVFPRRRSWALAAAAFVAFLPMHLFMSAAIDNDVLVELLLAVVLVILGEDLRQPDDRHDLQVGVAAGLAALAKLDGGLSAVLILAGFTGAAWRAADRASALRRLPRRLLRAGGVAILLSGWWFVRNLIVYGINDPFGLRRHAQVVVGQPLTEATSIAQLRSMLLTAFHSFWGQFGWMGIPYADRTYDVLAALSLLVALGVALFGWRIVREAKGWSVAGKSQPVLAGLSGATPADPAGLVAGGSADPLATPAPAPVHRPGKAFGSALRSGAPDELTFSAAERWLLGLLLLEVVLVIVGVVFYNLRYLQPQGRYLFPALPALAIFSVAGIGELIRAEHVGLVLALAGLALYGLCLVSLFQVIGPAFAGV